MIVVKDLRVDVLGEPLFEKVNFVLRDSERVGLLATRSSDASTFLRILAGIEEMDEGTVSTDAEKLLYLSSEMIEHDIETISLVHQTRPTAMLLDIAELAPSAKEKMRECIESFRGGILIFSNDTELMLAANLSRVIELHPATKALTSYTGTYADYLVEREKQQTRIREAYEKQQKEKRRIEEWLEQKRSHAAVNRSPEIGATIRTKKKYLKREILDKQIPNPVLEHDEEIS